MPPSEWTSTPSASSEGGKQVKAKYYDIVSIGLQECSHKDEWIECIQNYFETIRRAMSLPKQTHEMVVLSTATQWGITLVVFVRKDLMPRITSLCVDQVAAGGRKIVGVAVANKGAVMISFSLNGSTSLCFVGFCTLKHSSIFSRSLNSTLISSRVAVKSDALSSEVEVEITLSTFVVRLESLISDEPVTS